MSLENKKSPMLSNIGRKGEMYEKILISNREIFGVAVSTPSGN